MDKSQELIQVLIVDDQLVQREGIAKIVETTGKMHVVGMATNGDEATQIVHNNSTDLALIDLVLHGERGTRIGKELRRICPHLNVIIYTREKSMVLAADIFRERKDLAQPGLQGYILTRNISSSQYLQNVYDQIIQSGYFIDQDILRWHYQWAEIEPLTQREEECALLLASGMGNAEIARQMVISNRRVENIISNLYLKFKITGEPGDPSRRVLLAEGVKLLYSSRTPLKILKIVIIDDNVDYLNHLSRDLKMDRRLQIVAMAKSGQVGIDLVAQKRPDIALVDIHLPDMDGFRVVREILDQQPQIKVIMQSASLSTTYQHEAINSGAIALLSKSMVSANAIVEICYPDIY
jgi:DNA-binding NarL/FixJ family response regulator